MKRKPVVGETLYSLNVGNAARRAPQILTPMLVLSVGRKYFTCAEPDKRNYDHLSVQFHLDTWFQKAEFHSLNHALYESREEWEEEREADQIHKWIFDRFNLWSTRTLSLETLRKIKALIEEEIK